jgi:uncharacterized protein (DUF4415 family)
MPKTSRKPTIRLPTARENRAIIAAAKSDPDAKPLTAAQLKAMVPMRGRPKSANKKLLVSVRYSPEVVRFFRESGRGWQARMDGVLRSYVARKRKASQQAT